MPTEVESRYVIPDQSLFSRLRAVRHLGPFAARSQNTQKLTDHYLDTRGRALLRQGWACRLRSHDGEWTLTLKGPRSRDGAIVSRPEYEITLLERIQDFGRWPAGPIRERVRDLTGGIPLQTLVTIGQTRHKFVLASGSRPIGELSLDVVHTRSKDLRHRSYMLECELLPGGEVADLERLDGILKQDFGLLPEPRSKLRRALELLEQGSSPDDALIRERDTSRVEDLIRRYDIDSVSANRIADLAERLFDALLPIHGLDPSRKPLLRAAALLHSVGSAAGDKRQHIVGRDILLSQPIEGLGEEDMRIMAAAAHLTRKKVTAERIAQTDPTALTKETQRQVLTIPALVRLAASLDVSSKTGTHVHSVAMEDGGAHLTLCGPRAARDARRASKRSDLWELLFDSKLIWETTQMPKAVHDEEGQGESESRIGIRDRDTMSAAAHKTLAYHLKRMLAHEEGTRLGVDPEELHDMRVSTRRMRSALRLYGPFLAGRLVEKTNQGLRRAGSALGQVRDMDVALAKLESFSASQADPDGTAPLHAKWSATRSTARRRMLRYLNGQSYRALVATFQRMQVELLARPATAARSETVAYLAPRLIHIHWGFVAAYDAVLENAPIELLHALRIECKRLRYGLEFFGEILPRKVVAAIPDVTAAQDHLGEMHDAAVAIEMIDAFLARRRDAAVLEGVVAYREACREEMWRRLRTFPKVWRRLTKPKMRKVFKSLQRD